MVSSQDRLQSLGNIFAQSCPGKKHSVLASSSAALFFSHIALSAPKIACSGDFIIQRNHTISINKSHPINRRDQGSNGHHTCVSMELCDITGIKPYTTYGFSPSQISLCSPSHRLTHNQAADTASVVSPSQQPLQRHLMEENSNFKAD